MDIRSDGRNGWLPVYDYLLPSADARSLGPSSLDTLAFVYSGSFLFSLVSCTSYYLFRL